ncbi:hypothetical protein HBI56_053830 [Parastagonospora nodorum]|uniref:Uncharacterized protein n=2 Tax=Phaeosphaeria nodorum (strain SN15 / ATCC MYA-4574 / FGSC 10173) TaxID=321614 RepID=A0A7U2NR61_PHANO|nr:hypothetical protein SNOG_13242 [Parastagonospora nodorum SN15]KAH3914065.1 hypothetical protein HBH56_098250 [Parastagonospora nodorum]EAT79569.1 hypothetical protein SNOG_13242 [Parastagonospora nodorum SN15]KAH3930209.1 hypothetical protein HBH54_112570 [Parastagonospora nodorum]KAH3938997.1 hypothetical protein HBH53_242100 [Parastagonospora nodorum]KAH3964630.1 hypothetical protein HBH51_159450 [Parastagonospora nodorum]
MMKDYTAIFWHWLLLLLTASRTDRLTSKRILGISVVQKTVDDLVDHFIEVDIDASTQNSAQTGNLVASENIEKYKEWSSAQDCDPFDHLLPLAAIEELNKFMCDEIVRISKIPVADKKKPWVPPLSPLHHQCFPLWAKEHPANDVIRKHLSSVHIREANIESGTLPREARDYHLYHTHRCRGSQLEQTACGPSP